MKKNYQTYFKYIITFGMAYVAVSCNTRYLKDGEMLYTGAEINIENDTVSKKRKRS